MGAPDWTYFILNSGVVLTLAVSAAGVTKRPFPRLSEPSGLGPDHSPGTAEREGDTKQFCSVLRSASSATSDQTRDRPKGPPAWRCKPAEVAKVGAPGQGRRALEGYRTGAWALLPKGQPKTRRGHPCSRSSRLTLPGGRTMPSSAGHATAEGVAQWRPRCVTGSQWVQADSLSSPL